MIFLAWAYYGQNSESGLWQYCGMAFRMAVDIGINEVIDIYDSPAHLVRTRHLWWSLFIVDRIIAFSTGRLTTIPEEIVEIPLPEDLDFFPDPSCDTLETFQPIEPMPFPSLVRIMIISGRMSNVLNGRRSRSTTLVPQLETISPVEQLKRLQADVSHFLDSLPANLQWSTENLRHHHSRSHGVSRYAHAQKAHWQGTYLAVHLWSYALTILLHKPQLLRSTAGVETPITTGLGGDPGVAVSVATQICQCVALADTVSPLIYACTSVQKKVIDGLRQTAVPFCVQPMLIAGLALTHDLRMGEQMPAVPTCSHFMRVMAKQSVQIITDALLKVASCYAGASGALSVLKRATGTLSTSMESSSLGVEPLIPLPDTGMLRRVTLDCNHPKHLPRLPIPRCASFTAGHWAKVILPQGAISWTTCCAPTRSRI